MADAQMDYLDDEERELIESIEGAPHSGERLDPENDNRFRELLKVAARRKPKDTKITLRIASAIWWLSRHWRVGSASNTNRSS